MASFVRGRVDDQMMLTSHGRSSRFCVDPIEKKPLNPFPARQRGAVVRHRGLRPDLPVLPEQDTSSSREINRLADAAAPPAIAEAAVRLGCRSAAMTDNYPVIFLEYPLDVADACRTRGIKAVAVTARYVGEQARHDLFGHLAAANTKAFTEDFHPGFRPGTCSPC